MAPAAAHEQNGLGDPQKAPPCGDPGNAMPTGMVTAFQAGETITITIDETIYHPGHYRVAIAPNDPSELPPEPLVTEGDGYACGTAVIQNPVVYPVLADGVLVHAAPFGGVQSFDVTLPSDLSCDSCTLQIIQFMSEHGLNDPGGCYYHHCATISVQGGVSDTSGSAEDTGSSGGGEESSSATTATTATTQPETASDSDEGETTVSDDSGTTGATTVGTTVTATGGSNDDGDDEGCGCTGAGRNDGIATLAMVCGLLALRRRRRTQIV